MRVIACFYAKIIAFVLVGPGISCKNCVDCKVELRVETPTKFHSLMTEETDADSFTKLVREINF